MHLFFSSSSLSEIKEQHLFVLPTFGENYGYAIFESLAIGRPVLISDQTRRRNSTVTSQVTSGITGLFTSATDAMSKITGTVAYIGESAINIVQ